MLLPTLLGTAAYSIITGFYREPLYWLGIFLTIPKLLLFMLLPSLLYTVIMEILGIKLIQRPEKLHQIRINVLIYMTTGVLMGGLITLVLGSFFWLCMIGILTGLVVTTIKLTLHLSQKSAIQRTP